MPKTYTPDPLIMSGADYARRQGIRNHQFSALRFGDHVHVIDCRNDMAVLMAIVVPGVSVQAQVTPVEGEQCPKCAPAAERERTLTPEIRIEGDHRIEIEANFDGLWSVWIWTVDGRELLAHRETVVDRQIEQTVSLMRARLIAGGHQAAVEASTCGTCRDGCSCSGGPDWDGPTGCSHLGCWGPNATFACPEAIRLTADREGR